MKPVPINIAIFVSITAIVLYVASTFLRDDGLLLAPLIIASSILILLFLFLRLFPTVAPKKTKTTLMKTAIYLLLAVAFLHVSIFAYVIAKFTGNGKFYTPFIIINCFLLLLFTFLHMFRFVTSKKMKKAWFIFLSLSIASCGINEGIKAYDRSFIRIREGDVNLKQYSPFEENTRAAVLGDLSTLRLETDLPLLDGATALYPVYSAFAQAVYPRKSYSLTGRDHYNPNEVICTNTIRAYKRLINKTADIIFVAPPSKDQLNAAEEAGVNFRYTPIGKEAFVFFVNARNPVEDLTVEQIRAIYSGKIRNWKEVGGKDEAIRPFQRNRDSGSQTAFVNFMEGETIMEPPMEDVVSGMGKIVSQAANYANYGNSIGFSFRFYVNEMVKNKEVKILKINGVYPDLETIKSGTYPMASSFFAITLADNEKPNVVKFLDWMVSEQGQYLVEKTGYSPIK
ncbi:MAG: substrate-binding domain-containing protein [Azoarcus sp.]|jgi:phosphate transport system substrate-binding protein|nr:substrate-binding domain-containing protein [Azoarcus sp.]